MDALGPDLQTIYNLLHDLKRFPLSQSEHQAERSCGKGRGVLCTGKSLSSASPGGCPGEGEGVRDLLCSRRRVAAPGCCGGRQDGAVISVIRDGAVTGVITGVFLTLFGASGACASRSSGRRSGACETGSSRAEPQPLSPQTLTLRAEGQPEPATGPFAQISCCRCPPGLRAAHGSCLTALRHLPPRHHPVPLGSVGAPLAFYKGAKEFSNYFKKHFFSACCLQCLPSCLHLPVLESPCKGNCSQPELNGGHGLEATQRQNAKQSVPGECLCVCLSVWGGSTQPTCCGFPYTVYPSSCWGNRLRA